MQETQIIAERLKNVAKRKIYPEEAVEMHAQLAGLYAFYSETLEDILLSKPQNWARLREKHKSDKSTDLEWYATENGKNERGITMRLKSITKMMSALKSIITNASTEMNNKI